MSSQSAKSSRSFGFPGRTGFAFSMYALRRAIQRRSTPKQRSRRRFASSYTAAECPRSFATWSASPVKHCRICKSLYSGDTGHHQRMLRTRLSRFRTPIFDWKILDFLPSSADDTYLCLKTGSQDRKYTVGFELLPLDLGFIDFLLRWCCFVQLIAFDLCTKCVRWSTTVCMWLLTWLRVFQS